MQCLSVRPLVLSRCVQVGNRALIKLSSSDSRPSSSRMSMSNRARPMSGIADGVSHFQVLDRAGNVHHGADQ